MSAAASSVSYSSDSDEDIDIETDSPKRVKVLNTGLSLLRSYSDDKPIEL